MQLQLLKLLLKVTLTNVVPPEYNIALGQRRADAVKGFLAGKGVDAGKVSNCFLR